MRIGIDVGGTFTDCVLVDRDGRITADKAFTVPHSVASGMLEAIANAVARVGLSLDEVLAETEWLAMGTTSLTNVLVTRSGARTGLLTTRGHEDVTIIGRVLSKTEGLPEAELRDILAWRKPTPIVPRQLIEGVTERVDYKGAVVVSLDEADLELAVSRLVSQGVKAIAICFLWSFLNPAHERAAAEYIRQRYPDVFVITSSQVAPVLGEYERCNSTILSAYLGPAAAAETRSIRAQFEEKGFGRSVFVMQSNGGVVWDEEIAHKPISVLGSGPIGGAIGAARLGELLGFKNVICTDMGGTSFDVGIIRDGQPHFVSSLILERFRCFVPAIEVVSIGAGGGSIAWLDDDTGSLHVGPASAGSDPGPVCYGRGGSRPTVTDADVVLGHIDPARFFGGRKQLDRDGAFRAIQEQIAGPLGMDPILAAKGILDIVDARMADLIRSMTVERGHDPRDFVLFAYGGAGPTHVGSYARELGVSKAVISPYSSVFSALGIVSSEIIRFLSRSLPMRSPFDRQAILAAFTEMESSVKADWSRWGLPSDSVRFARYLDLRFRFQAQEVRVGLVDGTLDLEQVLETFRQQYEHRFGQGTALPGAATELVSLHLVASVAAERMRSSYRFANRTGPSRLEERLVFFDKHFLPTPVYDYGALHPDETITGPAVIEVLNTTAIIHPDQSVSLDEFGNVVVQLEGARHDSN